MSVTLTYDVRVRKISFGKERNIFESSWRRFGSVKSAIEFCATTTPYDGMFGDKPQIQTDWVIEITVGNQVLELIAPADWKALATGLTPLKWTQPEIFYKWVGKGKRRRLVPEKPLPKCPKCSSEKLELVHEAFTSGRYNCKSCGKKCIRREDAEVKVK